MIHTFADIRFTLAKEYPSIDPDTLNSVVNRRYKQCLRADGYEWSRLTVTDAAIQIVGQYITGTVTLTNGSTAVLGDGTNAWASTQDQYSFRAVGRDEFYTFSYETSNTAALDRPYEGISGSGLSYFLWKRIYALPADCTAITAMRCLQVNRPMEFISRRDLDFDQTSRLRVGYPRTWSPYDDTSDGCPQVEINPIPFTSMGLTFDYKTALNELTQPSDPLPGWFPWDALLVGCEEELTVKSTMVTNRMTGIWAARQQQVNETKFQNALNAAISEDCNYQPPQQIAMDTRLTAHRLDRMYYQGSSARNLLRDNEQPS